jgi:hypothetical protein
MSTSAMNLGLCPLAAMLVIALIGGCAAHQSAPPAPAQTPAADQRPVGGPAAPEAKIHISYAHRDEFLDSLIVTKYSSAQSLASPAQDTGATIVRFDTGIVVWQFAVAKAFLSGVPGLGSAEKGYAPAEVKYGDLPEHFEASIPESGPPEPLEPNHYYVFAVTRGSGSVSYEAVKVNGDGSLEAYEADPRAGTSYRLCCNVAADFTLTPPPAEPQ